MCSPALSYSSCRHSSENLTGSSLWGQCCHPSVKVHTRLYNKLTVTSQGVNMRNWEKPRERQRKIFWVDMINLKGNLQRPRKLGCMRQKAKHSHRMNFRSDKYLYFILIWFSFNSLINNILFMGDIINNILFMGDRGFYDVFLNTVMINITNVIC